MEEYKTIAKGPYIICLKEISKEGIMSNSSWTVYKKTARKIRYKCNQKKCNCRAEICLCEDKDETTYTATIIGNHSNHENNLAKPIRKHLIATIAKASYSENNIKEAIATEMAIQVSPQTIYRIKKSISLGGSWEILWRKIPSFVEALNQKIELAAYKEIENSNFILIFMAMPYIQSFVESEASLNLIFIDGTF